LILLDTSGLFAALDRADPEHEAARDAVETDPGPLVLSPFVLAELDYLVSGRVGVDAELALLEQVSSGTYRLEPFDAADVATAVSVVEQYRELAVGLADASLVVLARKLGTERILTLDERHFRVLRPLQGGSFTVLPSDL
jgi:predicted nucleic acid-binding protein